MSLFTYLLGAANYISNNKDNMIHGRKSVIKVLREVSQKVKPAPNHSLSASEDVRVKNMSP